MQTREHLIGKECVLYKLTDEGGYTRRYYYNAVEWSVGCTREVVSDTNYLCSPDVLHAYVNPYLAVFMNHAHAQFDLRSARMFKAKGVVVVEEGQLKVGVKKLTILEEIPVPAITEEQKDEFCIKVMLEVLRTTIEPNMLITDTIHIKESCIDYLEAEPADRSKKKGALIQAVACKDYYGLTLFRRALDYDTCVGAFIDWFSMREFDYISLLPKEMQ